MKHLYLTIFALVIAIGSNQSYAQNVVHTDASGINVCDGTAFNTAHDWMSSTGMWSWSWYQDSIQIAGADSIITNLCPGNYSLVIDSMGISFFTEPFTIKDPCSDFQNYLNPNSTSPNSCTGFVVSNTYGGYPPYIYSWSTGDSTSSIYNLCPGNYTVTAVDSLGCTRTESVTIVEEFLNATFWSDGGYYANCSGQASITPYGGTPPYSILWSTGDTTDYQQYLCDGTYSVTVVDAANDSLTFPFTIEVQDPQPLAANSWAYDDYYSTCSGWAEINPYGGTQPYSMHWSTGDSSYSAYNLCKGTYTVTIVDALNDSLTLTLQVGPVPQPLAADFWSHDNSYFYNSSECSGIAYVHPRGGTPPYSIQWSSWNTTESVDHLCVGNHSVTVVDAANDSLVFTFTIDKPFASTTWSSNGYSDCEGIAAVYPFGGTPPYFILWNTGDTTNVIDSLCPGVYSVATWSNEGDTLTHIITIDSVEFSYKNSVAVSNLQVAEKSLESVSIYPNPFSSSISVDNKDGMIRSLKLMDLNGRVLSEMSAVNSGVVKLDQLETLSSGTYLLILSGENTSKTIKVIK